jgi:2-methylaconitate cis-trans-isomerase PrpF
VGASVRHEGGAWIVEKAVMSRSARRLMEGWVRVPAEALVRAPREALPVG